MKKFVLIFLFFLILIYSIYRIVSTVEVSTIVAMTEDGFVPQEVTVDKNTFVKFVNKDSVGHWPASNIHPTHEIYPEFDPRAEVAPGRSWIFKAGKRGVFRYHDHLNPHKTGILIIKEKEGEFFNFLSQIKSTILYKKVDNFNLDTESFKDIDQKKQILFLSKLAKSAGAQAAWQYVVSTYKENQVANNAHDLAHFVGGLIYQEKGLNGLIICDSSFAYGCYHGFSERAFSRDLHDLSRLEKACELLGKVNSGPWASCIHGIGHGIATYFYTANLKNALNTCQSLSNGQTYCYDGVFMEFAKNAQKSLYEHDAGIGFINSKNDSLYPCSVLDEKYKQACARQQPQVMTKYFHMQLKDIIKTCLYTQDKTIKYYCIDSIGLNIGQKSRGDPKLIQSECKEIPDTESYAQCVSAGASEIVFQNYKGWESGAYSACETLGGIFRSSCNKRVEEVVQSYSRERSIR